MKKQLDVDKRITSTAKTDKAALDLLNQELEGNNKSYILTRQFPWIHNIEGALAMTIEY